MNLCQMTTSTTMNSVNAAITQVPSEQGGIDIVGYESSINTDN